MSRGELATRVEWFGARAALAVAERDRIEESIPSLRALAEEARARVPDHSDGPIAMLAKRLHLGADHVDFVWSAIALAADPRTAIHAEALAGTSARRGMSVALHARIIGLDATRARELAIWLGGDNPLVAHGILLAVDDGATAVARILQAPQRLLAFANGDATAVDVLLRRASAPREPVVALDSEQLAIIDAMRASLARGDGVTIVEGPSSSGRLRAIAEASPLPVVALDLEGASVETIRAGLLALRREVVLADVLPVLADADRMPDEAQQIVAEHLRDFVGPLVVTASQTGFALRVKRPVIRFAWRVADVATRRLQWEQLAGEPIAGDLDGLATRFRIGSGTMSRAIRSARLASSRPLDVPALVAGLRHNITEELGDLVEHVEVTQTWDDLVLAQDTVVQIESLVARVHHAHQVLESWGYRSKMARGTGVPALFSGPPGTGKTMVAGLIARELGLDLYQVDLSQVVSKWVGETEKQLARVFDVAEQGHGLLLFDEADALFGQRTQDVKGAVDRYANLEVNYLLQRIEAFNGITILTTNLDQSIDSALKRRLAAHIVFELPDDEEREQLWRRMMATGKAPLDRGIDVDALVEQFPRMSGANIRNATLTAAFLAASHGLPAITHEALLGAARAEYRSMGHVLSDRR